MLTIAWILVFALLIWIFGKWEANQFNPNQQLRSTVSAQFAEVILAANNHHGYVSPGRINGRDVIFLLDTGATDVVLSKELADELKLPFGLQGMAYTANGTVRIWDTQVEVLELGPIRLENINASINPSMDGNEVLLGMSALRHLEITQRDNQLTIRQSRP